MARSASFRTSDGRSLLLRPFGPRDAPALLHFANAMFDQKRTNRDLGVVSFDKEPTMVEEREFKERKEVVSVTAFDGRRLVGHCNIK